MRKREISFSKFYFKGDYLSFVDKPYSKIVNLRISIFPMKVFVVFVGCVCVCKTYLVIRISPCLRSITLFQLLSVLLYADITLCLLVVANFAI